MKLSGATPILRIFDEGKAREFYVDFLGFTVDWQHRFGDKYLKPHVEEAAWGDRMLSVVDPFGNRLTFFTATR